MPIENERKFLLAVEDPAAFKLELRDKYNAKLYDITQGYLSGHARVRHFVAWDKSEETHVFTYKTLVDESVVEIETAISLHDYEKLWTVTKEVIHKTRAKIQDGDVVWEIDFFKCPKRGEIYLVMAEVELPEFQFEPKTLPYFIKDNLLYKVPLNDERFKNKRLQNPKKVRKLLKEIRKEVE
jgi:CYTH domain-containing protein